MVRLTNKTPKAERLVNIQADIDKVKRKKAVELKSLRTSAYVWPKHREGATRNIAEFDRQIAKLEEKYRLVAEYVVQPDEDKTDPNPNEELLPPG